MNPIESVFSPTALSSSFLSLHPSRHTHAILLPSKMRRLTELKFVILFVLVIVIILTCIVSHLSTNQVVALERKWRLGKKMAPMESSEQKTKLRVLKKSLRRIARDDNILIIATLDAASRSLFDLFIESFRVGERTDVLMRHLLVLATDQKALEHCRSSHKHCHLLLGAEGNSSSAADDGHVMMRQLEFQQTLIELGYSFIYTDLDVMWFRIPWRHLESGTYLGFATDLFEGDAKSLQNVPNGGLMYVKACGNNVELYKYWKLLCKQYPTADRQSILSKGLADGVVPFNLRFQFLDTANFGGFCQPRREPSKVCTVQANCCGSAEEKARGLRSLIQDWKKYRSISMEEKEGGGGFSWSNTSRCEQ